MSSAHLTKLKRKATELEQKKQFEKALALYIQVIDEAGRDLDDADLQLYNRVGDLLMRQGNVSEALAYYEKAVDMYAERGFLNNAIALCNKILRQSPARTAVYYKLGKISASKGFRSDARKNFLEYADRMQKGGHLDEAFRALKEFADLCPDQDDIRLMLADLLTKENRTGEALEQLEQLYAKLEAEGRAAEARATMDRIKAIDPELTPRTTGTYQAQKSNDLVFLDLGDAAYQAPRPRTPERITPLTPIRAVDVIDVRGVGALQGLTITFLPDDDPAPSPAVAAEPVPSLEGLEVNAAADPLDASPAMPDLETSSAVTPPHTPAVVELAVDHPEFTTPEDVVPTVDGFASSLVTLTGAHPSLAPLLEEPPLSGAEFGALHIAPTHDGEPPRAHDLAIESSLPLLDGEADDAAGEPPADGEATDTPSDAQLAISAPALLDETPDEWVAAALQAPRDDFTFDRLLTPLDSPVVRGDDGVLPELTLPADVTTDTPALSGDFTVDELLTLPEPSLPGLTIDEPPVVAVGADQDVRTDESSDAEVAGAGDVAGEEVRITAESEAVAEVDDQLPDESFASVEAAVSEAWTSDAAAVPDESDAAEAIAPEAGVDDVADAPPVGECTATADDEGNEGAVAAQEGVTAPDEAPSWPAGFEAAPAGADAPSAASAPSHPTPTWSEGDLPPEFVLEEYAAGGAPAPSSALDTAALRAGVERPEEPAPLVESAPPAESGDPSLMRSAFEEERVELPLIDLESAAFSDDGTTPAFEPYTGEVDDMLSAPPTFGDGTEPSGFDPAPLDLSPNANTDEWGTPEVLIDGEWRDEHVGDLVSGEMFVVGERRDAEGPGRSTFDDLDAAMLYEGDTPEGSASHADRLPTPAAPEAFNVRNAAHRSRLSFGGNEAQLRRRLELAPTDTALRRQLGEALLDVGEREDGLNELEIAVREYELRGDLERAREVVDVILRVVPLSVRHHQKRVEYAVRASDRPRLVEAYTELADSLFRCGEPDKARVVYSRVLELSPSNDRARFALSMLADDAGLPRSSDEIPTIDTGILSGAPSVLMATLTPEAVDALSSHDLPLRDLPLIADVESPPAASDPDAREPAAAGDQLDAEVDAAFAADAPEVKEARRKTTELVAVEEWAAAQPPAIQPQPESLAPPGTFVDLGSWLRGTEPEKSTRMVTTDVAPSGDEGADFAEMLRRFKQGVAANVDEEDFSSHYDLGVAFKEMGLVDEAIAQFQKSLRGPYHRIRSYEALGQCFVEKARYDVALALLQRAADSGIAEDQELVGVLYLLGFACESVGRQQDAVGYYQRVFAVDIEFRDVAHRLAALARNAK